MKRTFGFWGLLALTTVLAIGPELWPATAEGQSRARRTAPPSRSDAEEERSTRRKPRGRVPRFYGKVGLSDKQRESIYTIQGRYRKQIAELMQQLQDVRDRQMRDIENVLSDDQRMKIAELVKAARKSRGKSRGKPKSKKPSSRSKSGRSR